jgi:hypothetical protein
MEQSSSLVAIAALSPTRCDRPASHRAQKSRNAAAKPTCPTSKTLSGRFSTVAAAAWSVTLSTARAAATSLSVTTS